MESTSYRGNIKATSIHIEQLSLVLVLFSILILMITMPIKSQAIVIYPNTALIPSSSSVWTSPNGAFSMGFFSLLPGTYYVGIRYASLPLNQSIIWTANRNQSVPANSTLHFTLDGRLQLTTLSSNSSNINLIIWEAASLFSLDAIFNASQAELLDSGNFVLRDSTSKILWQSFDHPTDTLLPTQNFSFSSNPSLVSWSSINDPSPSSKYSLVFGRIAGSSGGRIRLLYQNSDEYWSEPPPAEVKTALFNTTINIDATGTISLYNGDGNLIWLNTSCDHGIPNSLTKFQLSVDGNLRVLTWSNASGTIWETKWRAIYLQCEVFGTCGDSGVCDQNKNIVSAGRGVCPLPEAQLEQTLCSCPQGYTRNGSNCTPPSSLNCSQYMSNMEHTSFGVPGTKADYSPLTQKDCVDRCLNDCNCTAASYSNASSECWLYHSSLFNGMRFDQINQTSFIKTIATNFTTGASFPSYDIALIVVAISLILLLLFAGLFIRHRKREERERERDRPGSGRETSKEVLRHIDPNMDAGLQHFSWEELSRVTDGFHKRNELGKGGCGCVYKGTLTTPRGKLEVAIKMLNDKQGKDFRAEIKTLGSAQHENVVKLMGYCEEPELLLVYEYVKNGSLKKHIESRILSWNERFQIAVEVATGIEYLHAHKILHRDIKPENILITEDFKAKVADFGLSRIMDPDRTHLTTCWAGTPTYMAPECMINGKITEKSDVFSYGLVLLELVSGRRVTKEHDIEEEEEGGGGERDKDNDNSQEQDSKDVRKKLSLKHARHMMETRDQGKRLVDERMAEPHDRKKAESLVKVVFSCIQENRNLRPCMKDVLSMIQGEEGRPVFCRPFWACWPVKNRHF